MKEAEIKLFELKLKYQEQLGTYGAHHPISLITKANIKALVEFAVKIDLVYVEKEFVKLFKKRQSLLSKHSTLHPNAMEVTRRLKTVLEILTGDLK